MAKGKASRGKKEDSAKKKDDTANKKEPVVSEPQNEPADGFEDDYPNMGLKIILHSLENFISEGYPVYVRIGIAFKGEVIDFSDVIEVSSDKIVALQFETFYELDVIDEEMMESFSSNPLVLFLEMAKAPKKQLGKGEKSSSGGSTGHSSGSSGKQTPKKGNKSKIDANNIHSKGNLDVLPILLGENCIREKIPMESTDYLTGPDVIPYASIPFIAVTVEVLDYCFKTFAPPFCNILTITVESVYNAIPSVFNTNDMYIALTPLPNTKRLPLKELTNLGNQSGMQEKNPEENDVTSKSVGALEEQGPPFSILQFTLGEIVNDADRNFRKRWTTLSELGRSAFTKYRISEDVVELKNHLSIDVKKKMEGSGPRILWDCVQRVWLNETTQEAMFQALLKYKCWPVEFRIQKEEKQGKDGKKTPVPKELPPRPDFLYIAYLDLSNLLYPGVHATRITGQLMTYTDYDANSNWNMKEPLGDTLFRSTMQGGGMKGNNAKSSAKKPKTADKKKKKDTSTAKKEEEPTGPVPIPEEHGQPLLTPNGEPIFVIVEVELMKPLIPKKTLPQIEECLSKLIPKRKVFSAIEEQYRTAKKGFESTIRLLTDFITKEYKDFRLCRKSSSESSIDIEEEEEFAQYLHISGGLTWTKETLQAKLLNYVRHKYHYPEGGLPYLPMKDYISNVHCLLVDEMHRVVNEMIDAYKPRDQGDEVLVTKDELLFFATEAQENGDLEKAKKYLLKRIKMSDLGNPNDWIDLAISALRFGDGGYARECVKEALSLDSRHKDGLLMYAVLLTMSGELESAEFVFNALLEFYPRFLEGWTAFHLLYLLVEKPGASDITLLMGTKCTFDLPPSVQSEVSNPILAWYVDEPTMQSDNVFLRTTIYLLRLNLLEMAEICLAQEMSRTDEASVMFSYYLAVSHYNQGKFENSNAHLENIVNISWKDDRIWSLMGHNYWRLGNKEKAMHCYQFVIDLPHRPDDIFLTYLRMGYYKLEDNKDEEAKSLFLRALNYKASPNAWLGLGISYYMLNNFDDAELALCEANMLDHEIPEVWAYLALINIKQAKKDQATQCFIEANKYGLEDEELLGRIKYECKANLGTDSLKELQPMARGESRLNLINEKYLVWYIKPNWESRESGTVSMEDVESEINGLWDRSAQTLNKEKTFISEKNG